MAIIVFTIRTYNNNNNILLYAMRPVCPMRYCRVTARTLQHLLQDKKKRCLFTHVWPIEWYKYRSFSFHKARRYLDRFCVLAHNGIENGQKKNNLMLCRGMEEAKRRRKKKEVALGFSYT